MARTSIRDVAQAAGVSITTVSKALNGYSDVSPDTQKKVEQIARALNYEPDINARSLGGRTSISIALLISGLQATDKGGFTFGIISGLYHSTLNHGAEFMLLTTSAPKQSEKSFIQLCRQKNVNGVVVLGFRTDDPYYEEVINSEIPCVLIDINVSGQNIACVSTDNENAAFTAVNYLIENGHRNLAMVNGSLTAQVARERFAGYAKALAKHSIVLDMKHVCDTDFDDVSAYKNVLALLSENKGITAFFCASDLIAMGALRAIDKLKLRVPADISVIGFDDIPTSEYIHGGLTTIRQNPFLLGKTAGDTVIKMLKKKEVPRHIRLPFQLIVRQTTRKLC